MIRRAALLVLLVATVAGASPLAFLPGYAGINLKAFPAANTLYCVKATAAYTVTATKFGGYVGNGVGASTTGFSIYLASDGSQVAEASASSASAGGITATGLSFTVTAGTRYMVCACGTSTSTQYLAAYDATTGAGRMADLLNAVNVTAGSADTSCTTGNPPSSIGTTLTALTTIMIPLVNVE